MDVRRPHTGCKRHRRCGPEASTSALPRRMPCSCCRRSTASASSRSTTTPVRSTASVARSAEAVRTATNVTLAPPPGQGKYSASIPVSATLTDASGGPIAQRPVRFTLGPTSVVAYTGSDGVGEHVAPAHGAALVSTNSSPPSRATAVSRSPRRHQPRSASCGCRQPSRSPPTPPAAESPAGTWHASSIVGDPTVVYATVNNENGAPVTERSVLFVAYKTGTNNAVRRPRRPHELARAREPRHACRSRPVTIRFGPTSGRAKTWAACSASST